LKKELEEFKELILKGEFYEAHEVLEEVWQGLRKGDDKMQFAYKGLINAAVAMELEKRGRNSAYIPWRNFEKYKPYYKIDKDFEEIVRFIEEIKG